MAQSQNIIFWGAGATAALGMRTTKKQESVIQKLADTEKSDKPLDERIAEALGRNGTEPWHSALCDLITILGDTRENYRSIHHTNAKQIEAMSRNWGSGAV
jgi:hypothetical protein